jgi:hypothetical protein
MANNIERFVRDNRDSFDENVPPSKIWENIEKELKINPAPAHKMRWIRWTMAAAATMALGIGIWWIYSSGSSVSPVAQVQKDSGNNISPEKRPAELDIADIDPAYAQQVVQFISLIDKKQDELKSLGKDQPELYRKFSSDIERLDSTYAILKLQLPVNPNKEELLQAMISNLQLQIDLLNQQLNIINKIKQSKTKGNEKNNTSI